MKHWNVIIQIGFRNILRNKRRTLLTLMTITVGCAMIIFMNSIARGGHDAMIEDAVAVNTGHIQIQEKEYQDNKTIEYGFQPYPSLLKLLNNDPDISGYSMRIIVQGLLSYKDSTAGVTIQGVDPENEKMVSNIYTKILQGGRYLKGGDNRHIVIGYLLAKRLGIGVGDKLSLLSQGFDGSIAAERLTVLGIFKTGQQEYDRNLGIMPINQTNETFSMNGYIHTIAVKIKNLSGLGNIKERVGETDKRDEIIVMEWEELMPVLVQIIVMDNVGAYIFDFILFLVVAFSIFNTINMSVFERRKEIGIMIAIGTRPSHIVKMIFLESSIISLIGIIIGIFIGCAASYYFKLNPLSYGNMAEEMAVWGVYTTRIPANTTPLNILLTSSLTLLLSLIFTTFPAISVSRLKLVQSIRGL